MTTMVLHITLGMVLTLLNILTSFLLPHQAQASSITDFLDTSHWTFEEATGVRYDSNLVSTNDLTDNNTVLSGVGKKGNAADFERSNSEYLSIIDSNQSGLDFQNSWTISFWYKPESQPAATAGNYYHPFLNKYANSGSERGIRIAYACDPACSRLWVGASQNGTSETQFTFTQTFSNGTWYHVSLRYDSSTGQFSAFVNGTNIGNYKLASSGSLKNNTQPLLIGCFNSCTSSVALDGLLDEFSYFPSALATTSIVTLYNSGTPLDYESIVTQNFCAYTNNYDMNGTLAQVCVTDGATTTCEYEYSATTTPVQMTSDDLLFALALLFFVICMMYIAFIFNTLFVKK